MINELKRLVHETSQLPSFIEEVETWRNEMNDILNDSFNQEDLKILRTSAQNQFVKAFNEAEKLRNRLEANISILNLCAAFVNTGRMNELAQVLSPTDKVKALKTEEKQGITSDDLELKTFKVLEAKKRPDGETRAWCQMPDGNKKAFLSEGEIAEAFLASKGKEIKAWCSKEGKDFRAKKLA